MKRLGCFVDGMRGNWEWSRDGEKVASIGYHCTGGSVLLDYRVRLYWGEWEPIKQTVPLSKSDCHYGGQRIYARCPGVVNGKHCGRRVGKLDTGRDWRRTLD